MRQNKTFANYAFVTSCTIDIYNESDTFVYFLCTLFSFNSEDFFNFAGINNQNLNSMLNIIKLLLPLFILTSSVSKGYCDCQETIIMVQYKDVHKGTVIPHVPIRVPVIYIQQQNNIISWEEDVMATTIVITDDNSNEVFSEEVEGRTSVTIPECIKGEYDLIMYIQSKEYIGRIEL